jgi:WD40 repeat protein
VNTRRSLVIALAVAAMFGITAVMQYAGHNTGRLGVALAQSAPDSGTIKSTWSVPVSGFRSASFSPDNAFFAVVGDPTGSISLWRRNGKMIWRLPVSDATNAVVAPNGSAVIAFAAMDPTRQAVTIIKGLHHDQTYKRTLDGAIWGATVSGNGKYGGVVTGAHSLYIFNLDGAPKFQRHALMGTGNSISISNDGSYLTSGTWDASGVACYNIKGDEIWQYQDGDSKGKPVANRLFEAQIAKDSPYILGVSYANVRQSNATLYLWHKTGHGKPMWMHPLDPDDSEPQAKISADGSHVALVYLHKIMHGDQSIRVRQLILLDRYNNSLWPAPKGGPLLSPNLVAISPDGNTVTVTDGQRALYNFDAAGRISAAKMDMNALIDSTVTSDDGKYVLVYTDDGKLTLVQPV